MNFFAVFVLAPTAFAQEANQGAVTGFVYDSSHAVVPNAELNVTSRATGQARTAAIGADGVYTILAARDLVDYRDRFAGSTVPPARPCEMSKGKVRKSWTCLA